MAIPPQGRGVKTWNTCGGGGFSKGTFSTISLKGGKGGDGPGLGLIINRHMTYIVLESSGEPGSSHQEVLGKRGKEAV